MNACALFPVGTASDTSMNTLGCRIYHTGLAAVDGGADPHCWHAGPYGFGVCGTECADFCTLATGWCSPDGGFDGGAPPYADMDACAGACPGFVKVAPSDAGVFLVDGGYTGTGPTGGNTLDCREYHLGAALRSHGAADQQLHCQHPGVTSATCM